MQGANPCPQFFRKECEMGDLISREQAIAEMHLAFGAKPAVHAQAVDILNSLPSAEKTGKWIKFSSMKHLFYCSVCGQIGERYWNYCPNCEQGWRKNENHI